MTSIAGRVVFHLLVPVLAFLFIGVPLETYVRGLDGFFSTSQDFSQLIREHLFLEAAACFYCITILLEAVLILSRPHIRSREGLPIGKVMAASFVLGLVLIAAYIYIRSHVALNDFNERHASTFLVVMIIATTIIAFYVHSMDYLSSSEVAPRPKSKSTTRKTR